MLVFDQLKKNDPQLRLLALAVLGGLALLLAGLLCVQIVSSQDYQQHMETQSFRTVRIPAVRGKILDRNGAVLAENRPNYNVSLYLDELRKQFDDAYNAETARVKDFLAQQARAQEKKLNRSLTKQEKKQFTLTAGQRTWIRQQTRYAIASNVVEQISERLQQPLALDFTNFERHYEARLALPYPIVKNLDPLQIARFEEQNTSTNGVDLEIQSTRFYPLGTAVAHLLGHLERDDSSTEGEEAYFTYRLPDYRGSVGIEVECEKELHGHAGAKSVLVNNLGYRQAENILDPAEPGKNVVLTIDLRIQQAAERALKNSAHGADTRGAVVVMDVRTGDILTLASSPSYDPNDFIKGIGSLSPADRERLDDPKLRPQINRATQDNYQPGSIFKPVVAMACLENGLNPDAIVEVLPNPADPAHGLYYLGRRTIRDTAPPGPYDFRRALIHSSNSYFITNGIHAGIENILKIGRRVHFGERVGLATRQETAGIFPSEHRIHSSWMDGDTANLCIGQGDIAVTPLQMCVLAVAIANGGKVLWPQLVDRIEPQDPLSGEPPVVFPKNRVRDDLGVKPRTLQILREAMLDDTESSEGTAYKAFLGSPVNQALRVCGKTGTAEVKDEHGTLKEYDTWFLAFAPYEHPRYAVVVMVEGGGSGGGTCAPIGREVFEAILKIEQKTAPTVAAK